MCLGVFYQWCIDFSFTKKSEGFAGKQTNMQLKKQNETPPFP